MVKSVLATRSVAWPIAFAVSTVTVPAGLAAEQDRNLLLLRAEAAVASPQAEATSSAVSTGSNESSLKRS